MEALNKVFANVCSLLVVTAALIQFGHNELCKFWGLGSLFWKK